MKIIFKRISQIASLVVVILLVVALIIRFTFVPENTRVKCDEYARKAAEVERLALDKERIYNLYYNSCFRQAGLKSEI